MERVTLKKTKIKKTKLGKPILISVITIILIFVTFVLFISPITKYVIEKYDEKYTGRQIKIGLAYVNPFTGYIRLSNFKIYESNSDSVFFSANSVSTNFEILKLFTKNYEISNVIINRPYGKIIQNKKQFNFDDLIEKFSPKEKTDIAKEPVHFSILKVKIIEGEFYFQDLTTPVNYFIKKVNIESEGMRWDTDTIATKFSFLSGIGSGSVKGNSTIDAKKMNYRLATVVKKFDLNIIQQYLNDLSNYGTFRAILDADIKAAGNFKQKENVSAKGLISISDFHVGKTKDEDYASFTKMDFRIIELSPINHKYLFDSVSLSRPFFKYEKYDHLDNLQNMFGEKGSNVSAVKSNPEKFNLIIEIGKYIKTLSKNFFKSDYKINRIAIYNADIKFADFSTSEKFDIDLSPLNIVADSIYKSNNWVTLYMKSRIKPYGNMSVDLGVNPKDSSDFNIVYNFQKIPAAMFNPYTVTYTSFPLDRGTIELHGNWKVRNGIIWSDNHLIVIDPRPSKRLRGKDKKWIPMPLIMSFVRERGNVIDYQIPITGDLKNPKFHVSDILLDLLKNIFVKPPTTPYRLEVKNIETEIEKSLTLQWQIRQTILRPKQEKFIERIADFLEKNPEASIDVYPEQYSLKEKEYILFYEAKKKYFMELTGRNNRTFSAEDSQKVNKMSVKDSSFVHYLNKHLKGKILFTVQDKCAMVIDSAIVNSKFQQLNNKRKEVLNFYFKEREVDKQVKIHSGKNTIPYNGFSFYKIKYKGEFPDPLLKAYKKMNELNEEEPRKKYKRERKKDKDIL